MHSFLCSQVSTLSSDEHESMGGAHSQVEAYIAGPTSPSVGMILLIGASDLM